MKKQRFYALLVYALLFIFVAAFVWDVASLIDGLVTETRYRLPVASFSLGVLYIAFLVWAKSNEKKLDWLPVNREQKSEINWMTAFATIQRELLVSDAKDVLCDNVNVTVDDIKPAGKTFDFRWNGYQRFLPLADFDLIEGEGWKIYVSKNRVLAFMFVFEMSVTPYCFSNLDLEEYFNVK